MDENKQKAIEGKIKLIVDDLYLIDLRLKALERKRFGKTKEK